MFIKAAPNSHGFVDADVTLKLWKKHFSYFYRENVSAPTFASNLR
jgi:hypothetical protein